MKVPILLLLTVLSVVLIAETVSKSSAAFSFPTTPVGIANGPAFQGANMMFGHSRVSNAVILEWALPVTPENGVISIVTLSGVKIKTFSITSARGTLKWAFAQDKSIANGIYFASFSSTSFKKNLKIVLY